MTQPPLGQWLSEWCARCDVRTQPFGQRAGRQFPHQDEWAAKQKARRKATGLRKKARVRGQREAQSGHSLWRYPRGIGPQKAASKIDHSLGMYLK